LLSASSPPWAAWSPAAPTVALMRTIAGFAIGLNRLRLPHRKRGLIRPTKVTGLLPVSMMATSRRRRMHGEVRDAKLAVERDVTEPELRNLNGRIWPTGLALLFSLTLRARRLCRALGADRAQMGTDRVLVAGLASLKPDVTGAGA